MFKLVTEPREEQFNKKLHNYTTHASTDNDLIDIFYLYNNIGDIAISLYFSYLCISSRRTMHSQQLNFECIYLAGFVYVHYQNRSMIHS